MGPFGWESLHFLFIAMNIYFSNAQNAIKNDLKYMDDNDDFNLLLQEIMLKSLEPYKCIVILADSTYTELFEVSWFRRFDVALTFVLVYVEEYEDLLSPFNDTQELLEMARREGCQLYIILMANAIQVTRLLRFGDRYRLLDPIAKYILLHDNRLFDKNLFYIWRRLINVVFIKRYEGKNSLIHKRTSPWYEITTVPFPSPISTVLVPRRLDIWAQSKFRKGMALFQDKTSDLKNQTLKIVAYSHIPGTAKSNGPSKTARALLPLSNDVNNDNNDTSSFSGVEVEIVQIIAKAMNFRCEIYEPDNADVELWGRKVIGGIFTGVIGEMVKAHADIALGDLYYTPYLLELMDLSIPYNTECLTFLTPESLTDNSWKTLILPFAPLMWAGVIICLIFSGIAFYILARFHVHITKVKEDSIRIRNKCNSDSNAIHNKKKKVITLSVYPEADKLDANEKYTLMKEMYQPLRDEDEPIGLYQFSEPVNSALYTYSMLLLVSLPKLPTGWSLRVLTGWYWLYCLLLVTSYRASMTAILAKPTPRVTIDTLQELVASRLTYGGWGEINMEFFKSSEDPTIKMISDNFIMMNSSEAAVDKVADASFAFYENTYFLKEALVKRQLRFQSLSNRNFTPSQIQEAKSLAKEDRGLHIMSDCIINMPVSIGLQKNSPIKPKVDKMIRIVLEAGLITKWLDDVMQAVLNTEVQTYSDQDSKALMNMKKFSGGLVALFIGYFISVTALVVEIVYFKYAVRKNPNFNKYSKKILNKKSE